MPIGELDRFRGLRDYQPGEIQLTLDGVPVGSPVTKLVLIERYGANMTVGFKEVFELVVPTTADTPARGGWSLSVNSVQLLSLDLGVILHQGDSVVFNEG